MQRSHSRTASGVSERHKTIPRQVQTRSRTRVESVAKVYMPAQRETTNKPSRAATQRSRARGARAVLSREGAVVGDGEVGRALLMCGKQEPVRKGTTTAVDST